MSTLVYCGLNGGGTFARFVPHYDVCYGFEPLPHMFNHVKEQHKNDPKVKLFNYALDVEPGEREFHVYSNNAASSFSQHTPETAEGRGKVTQTIKVQCVNLYQFFQEHGITTIDFYMSDIQGMDYPVLQTLKPMLDSRSIKKITCEVEKDDKPQLYQGLRNKFSDFQSLLSENYKVTGNVTQPGWVCSDITWELN